MIEWISVKESLPTKDGEYLTARLSFICGIPYFYEVLSFSLNLSDIDKYDFPKKQYKNKKGFYYLDRDYGYIEHSDVDFWAPLNSPNEREEKVNDM